MNIIITSSHYRRPQYTAKSVAAIASQPEASSLYYIASVDKSDRQDAVISAIEQYRSSFKEMSISVRDGSPSCNDNIKQALTDALKLNPDFVIMVEDDVVLGHDALAYFIQQAEDYKNNQDVLTVSAWRHPDGWLPEHNCDKPDNQENEVKLTGWFTPWGWGSWTNRIEEILEKWTGGTDNGQFDNQGRCIGSWDENLNHRIRGDRMELHPLISRAINIGDEDGTHRGGVPLSYWVGLI